MDARSHSLDRRRFMLKVIKATCGSLLFGLGLGLYGNQARALPATAIRPPGALDEEAFLGACLRCGLCVRDCPYDVLELAGFAQPVPTGTPFFEARKVACEMCEDIPCVKACPTGSLDHGLTNIDDARMGIAVLLDQENCIAYRGLRCEVCFNICPLKGKAISIERRHNERSGKHALFIPVVHSDKCTGCGKCEFACILDKPAIKVLPSHLAKGSLGEHYRLGWEEKARAGESLVTPDLPHEYNLPEGMEYEHGGEGLIDRRTEDSPFADDPLETLKRKL
ncbi:ferredoxin-type protein NapG [Kaarinaea lacus]